MAPGNNYIHLKESMPLHMTEAEDLEDNGSDTTRVSGEAFHKPYFLPSERVSDQSALSIAQRRAIRRVERSGRIWIWLRWGVVVVLQVIIVILLSVTRGGNTISNDSPVMLRAGNKAVETGGDINGLYMTSE